MANVPDTSEIETHFSRRLRLLNPDCEANQDRFLQRWAKCAQTEPEIYGTLTKAQVDAMARRNGATTKDWLAERDIFSVPTRQGPIFFAFQFRDGEPHPAIKPVLEVLPSGSAWQTAFWFCMAHSGLRGEKPMLQLDNPRIFETARQDGMPAGTVGETILTAAELAKCLGRGSPHSRIAAAPA